ncbi:MAG: peptide deformylase [Clostridiales bacterium]|nr:peptide deformylase [Clostridiales bacterium]
MAIRKILQLGDETLRKKSFTVNEINEKTIQLLDDMKDTLDKAQGAGLAAVQVGVLRRIFIVDVDEGFFEFINPEIISTSGEQYGIEGCLSVKGKWGDVKRPYKVTIKAQNRKGEYFTITAKDFFAKAICHEYDHLEGIVYVDKADNLRSEQ